MIGIYIHIMERGIKGIGLISKGIKRGEAMIRRCSYYNSPPPLL